MNERALAGGMQETNGMEDEEEVLKIRAMRLFSSETDAEMD
jgi:hypothetical protein